MDVDDFSILIVLCMFLQANKRDIPHFIKYHRHIRRRKF